MRLPFESHDTSKAIVDLNRAAEEVSFLSEAGKILSSSIDLHMTFRNLEKVIVPTLADTCVITLRTQDGNGLERYVLAHSNPEKQEKLRELDERFPPTLDQTTSGASFVIRSRHAELVEKIEALEFQKSPKLRILVNEIGLHSYMTFPLIHEANDKPFGAMWLGLTNSDRHYSQDDLRFGTDLACLAAQAVHNASLYRSALDESQKERVLRKIKDDYIHRQIHDLKTPLTAATLLLQLMERRAAENAKESVGKVLMNIRRSISMIDNLRSSHPSEERSA